MAAAAFIATLSTSFSKSHLVISSIATPRACWLCRSNVRASAVAIAQSGSSGMTVVLDEWCRKPSSSLYSPFRPSSLIRSLSSVLSHWFTGNQGPVGSLVPTSINVRTPYS